MSRRSQINLVISPRLLWEADCLRSADREGNKNDKICKRKKKKQGIRAFSSFVVICPLLVLRVVDAGRRAGDPMITSGFLFLPCVTIQHCPQSCFPGYLAVSQLLFSFHLRPFLATFGIVQVSWLSLFTFIPSLQLLLTLKGVCLPLCPSYLSFSVQWALVEVDRFPTWLQNLLRVGRGNLTILEVDIQGKKLEGLKAIFDGGYCFKDMT